MAETLVANVVVTGLADGAIVGEDSGAAQAAIQLFSTQYLSTGVLNDGDPGEGNGLFTFSVELWFQFSGWPIGDMPFIQGPVAGAAWQYRMYLTSATQLVAEANDAGTQRTVTSTLTPGPAWHHLVMTVGNGPFLRLYVNGVQVGTATWGGPFPNRSAGSVLQVGYPSASGVTSSYDELAVYRWYLTADRVAAHYQAGAQSGFSSQATGARINAILDSSDSTAPRLIQTGQRTVSGRYLRGQGILDEIRGTRSAEAVDSLFFVARDGTLVFLDSAHRSSSPYSIVQATFDDDGTDLPYADVTLDYSDSFIANQWSVTRQGAAAVTQTASDATSISRYFKRTQSVSGIPLTTDAQALAIAEAMRDKYSEPLTRITSLTLTTQVPEVAEAILAREIGDRIRVLRTPPGGGARIDQTLFIQKIEIGGANDGAPWQVRWGVSPV